MKRFVTNLALLGLITPSATALAAKGDICATFEVTMIEKGDDGKWQEKTGKGKSCKGTAKWGSFGESAKTRQYQIITYFKIPEFTAAHKHGKKRMQKSLMSGVQDTLFIYSEAFPKAKWTTQWKSGTKVETVSNILMGGKLFKVPTTVEIIEENGKRRSIMTSKLSRKQLGMPDINSDTFKINDSFVLQSTVPFDKVQGSFSTAH